MLVLKRSVREALNVYRGGVFVCRITLVDIQRASHAAKLGFDGGEDVCFVREEIDDGTGLLASLPYAVPDDAPAPAFRDDALVERVRSRRAYDPNGQ